MERSAKKARHYTLKNYGTGRYYCPPKTLLDTVKTSATACEIRIENASAAKGYYLYGDYDSDFVGDVLNVSKDAGMPVITVLPRLIKSPYKMKRVRQASHLESRAERVGQSAQESH